MTICSITSNWIFFTSVEAVLNALKHQKLTYNVSRYRIWKITIGLWYAVQKPLFSPITSHNFSWPYVIFELKVIIFEGIPDFLKNLQRVKIKQRLLVYSPHFHTSNTLYKVRNKLKMFTEQRDGINVHPVHHSVMNKLAKWSHNLCASEKQDADVRDAT